MQKANSFARRRFRNIILLGMSVAAVMLLVMFLNQSLWRSDFATGYILMGCLFFLASYNIRKKLTFLPSIGSTRGWMQVHIYVGFATIAIFVMHIGWRVPAGSFERLLASLYVIVSGSGIFGLYITRTTPKKLTSIRNEFIYEQIPLLRKQLINRVRKVVLESTESTDVLAKFYVRRLARYFERPRGIIYSVFPSSRNCRRLKAELDNLDRFLNSQQRPVRDQLQEMIQEKEDLDYHAVLQGRLKYWMFLHVGLTYGLLFVAVVHGIVVHAFAGGML